MWLPRIESVMISEYHNRKKNLIISRLRLAELIGGSSFGAIYFICINRSYMYVRHKNVAHRR